MKNIISYLKDNFLKILIFITILPIILIFIFYLSNKSNIYFSDSHFFYDNSIVTKDIYDYDSKKIININIKKKIFRKGLERETDVKNTNLKIKFKFYINHFNSLQNLFQTDDVNSGIRLEIQNEVISIISSEGNNSHYISVFNQKLKKNKLYDFEIMAIDGYGYYATLNNEPIIHKSDTFAFNLKNFSIGTGFDKSRKFLDVISNISYGVSSTTKPIVIKNFIKNYYVAIIFTAILYLLMFYIVASYVLRDFLIVSFRYFISTINKVNFNIVNVLKYLRIYNILSFYINTKSLTIFLFLCLCFYFPVYLNFIYVYLILLFLGVGFFITVLPKYYADNDYFLYFSPILGLLLVTIIGGYFIAMSINIKYLLYALPLYSLCILFIKAKRIKIFSLFKNTIYNINSNLFSFVSISFLIVFFILFPNILQPDTSFYRIGPDLSLYSKMSQYVIDGGILSDAKLRSHEFIDLSVGEINRIGDASASWPFMYYFRWGLTAFHSFLVFITPAHHAFQISFFSMIFSHLALGFITFYWLIKVFRLPLFISMLGAVAVIFNSNLLNLWFEGFYANSYTLFIFLILLSIIYWKKEFYTKKENISMIPFCVILFVAALLTYPEGVFFLLGPIMLLIITIELCVHRKFDFFKYLSVTLSLVIAYIILISSNYLIDWASIIISQLTEEGGNGYMQPHWALPHEVLGITNIYSDTGAHNGGQLLPRSIFNYFISIILSALIAIPLIHNFIKNYSKINPIFYTSYIIVAIIAIFVFIKSRENNYMYMKYYVFMLPILILFLWTSLNYSINQNSIFKKKHKNLIYSIVTFIIFVNGILYVAKYSYYSTYIDDDRITLYLENKNKNFENVIIYPYNYSGILYSYASLINARWLIPNRFDSKLHKNNLDKRLYLFIEKKYLENDTKHFFENKKNNFVYSGSKYLIFDTKLFLYDFVDQNSDTIKIEKIDKIVDELLH